MAARKIYLYTAVFLVSLVVSYGILFLFFSKKEGPKPIFLHVAGFWDPKVFNPLKSEFQKQNPQITIEYQQEDPQRYFVDLSADFASKKGPDVFWWHSGWGPEIKNNLDPIPPSVFSASDFEKTFYPLTQSENTDMKTAGTYRGLPLEIDGLALLYNKTTFASLNLPAPTSSWPTIREDDIGPLTSGDKKRILTSAIALGSEDNVVNFPEIVGLFLLQNGTQFISNNQLILGGRANVDSNGNNVAADAIDFYYYFSKTAKTWDNTQPNSIQAFAQGKTAMVLLSAANIHDLLDYLRSQNLRLDFGVLPVPQLPPPSNPVTWGSYWALGVNSASSEKGAAWAFSKFMVSEDSLRKVFASESALHDFGRAYPRVSMASEQTTNPYLAAYVVQAPQAKSWFLNSETFDQGLNDNLIAQMKTYLQKVEQGDSGLGVLDKLAAALDPILKKYGLVNTNPANRK